MPPSQTCIVAGAESLWLVTGVSCILGHVPEPPSCFSRHYFFIYLLFCSANPFLPSSSYR
ncbi:hypothetical protein GGR58DRAFT_473384 [Xylaria digitata]|nr:hypothetical protein GGR58DRAFT_473384 [Xylaria digitata]